MSESGDPVAIDPDVRLALQCLPPPGAPPRGESACLQAHGAVAARWTGASSGVRAVWWGWRRRRWCSPAWTYVGPVPPSGDLERRRRLLRSKRGFDGWSWAPAWQAATWGPGGHDAGDGGRGRADGEDRLADRHGRRPGGAARAAARRAKPVPPPVPDQGKWLKLQHNPRVITCLGKGRS